MATDPEDKFYILAPSAPDERTRVLKHGDTFAVFDRYGDVRGETGLFHEDTRYVSALSLRIDDHRPFLLGSVVQDNNAVLTVDLTNPDMHLASGAFLPRGALHLFRAKFILRGVCYERLKVRCFGAEPVALTLHLDVEADFADIFEVRGAVRARRGVRHAPRRDGDAVVFSYDGLDGRRRTLRLEASPEPTRCEGGCLSFDLALAPHEERTVYLTYNCAAAERPRPRYEHAMGELMARLDRRGGRCEVVTSDTQLNAWLERSRSDLRMMLSETEHGIYPYAGVPWFSTAFGRDGIITALETLWLDPDIARGVLRYLAATQAAGREPARVAEPGKILHETRSGEMAALGEVPFGRYYGSVDATPLYVLLAGEYYQATGDRELVEDLWPSIEAALAWMERDGDRDADGFLEYQRDAHGLGNQGWKDSHDAVFHADGSDAPGPIALCEVQAYAYAALRAAAGLALVVGEDGRAEHLTEWARRLQRRFEDAFWCDELGTYALALDGDKRQCRVVTSNPGHALFAEIARGDRARRLAQGLMGEGAFSGWGIRTVAAGQARYNPMSYHNGSVWPHDNALIARGMATYAMKPYALALLSGLFDASLALDSHRLPELFCGFPRRRGQGPVLYPVACSPQAWASGAVFMLLQSALGMSVDGVAQRVRFTRPALPPFVDELRVENLRVGQGSVSFIVHRYPDDVGINVIGRRGKVEVVNIK